MTKSFTYTSSCTHAFSALIAPLLLGVVAPAQAFQPSPLAPSSALTLEKGGVEVHAGAQAIVLVDEAIRVVPDLDAGFVLGGARYGFAPGWDIALELSWPMTHVNLQLGHTLLEAPSFSLGATAGFGTITWGGTRAETCGTDEAPTVCNEYSYR